MTINKESITGFLMLLVMLLLIISYQYVLDRVYITVVKASLLLLLCFLFVNNGIAKQSHTLLLGYFVLLLLTLVSGGDVKIAVFSFLGLSIPALFYAVNVNANERRFILYLFSIAPVLSVITGLFLNALGVWDVVRVEYTGAIRLQGAMIPAHLAFMSVAAMCMSTVLVFENFRYSYVILGVNVFLIFLTGTRMGIAIAVINLVYMFYRGAFRVTKYNLFLYAIVFLIIFFMTIEYLPILISRTFGEGANLNSDYGINASGRFLAWEFFYHEALTKPYLGFGLGSVILPLEMGLTHFGVPHNEYLRFFYEAGWAGLAVILLCYFYFYRKVYQQSGRNEYVNLIFIYWFVYSLTDNAVSTLQFTIPIMILLSSLRRGAV